MQHIHFVRGGKAFYYCPNVVDFLYGLKVVDFIFLWQITTRFYHSQIMDCVLDMPLPDMLAKSSHIQYTCYMVQCINILVISFLSPAELGLDKRSGLAAPRISVLCVPMTLLCLTH